MAAPARIRKVRRNGVLKQVFLRRDQRPRFGNRRFLNSWRQWIGCGRKAVEPRNRRAFLVPDQNALFATQPCDAAFGGFRSWLERSMRDWRGERTSRMSRPWRCRIVGGGRRRAGLAWIDHAESCLKSKIAACSLTSIGRRTALRVRLFPIQKAPLSERMKRAQACRDRTQDRQPRQDRSERQRPLAASAAKLGHGSCFFAITTLCATDAANMAAMRER